MIPRFVRGVVQGRRQSLGLLWSNNQVSIVLAPSLSEDHLNIVAVIACHNFNMFHGRATFSSIVMVLGSGGSWLAGFVAIDAPVY